MGSDVGISFCLRVEVENLQGSAFSNRLLEGVHLADGPLLILVTHVTTEYGEAMGRVLGFRCIPVEEDVVTIDIHLTVRSTTTAQRLFNALAVVTVYLSVGIHHRIINADSALVGIGRVAHRVVFTRTRRKRFQSIATVVDNIAVVNTYGSSSATSNNHTSITEIGVGNVVITRADGIVADDSVNDIEFCLAVGAVALEVTTIDVNGSSCGRRAIGHAPISQDIARHVNALFDRNRDIVHDESAAEGDGYVLSRLRINGRIRLVGIQVGITFGEFQSVDDDIADIDQSNNVSRVVLIAAIGNVGRDYGGIETDVAVGCGSAGTGRQETAIDTCV